MQLIRGLNNLKNKINKCVITIGNFDGIHLGHQALINTLLTKSAELSVPAVVITFEPQPNEFFSKNNPVARLTRFREKCLYLQKMGVDYVMCIRFNEAFAQISAEEFVGNILLNQMGMQAILVGDDFRFGAKRAGDFDLLRRLSKQYHFQALQMPAYIYQNARISSTRVRDALLKSDLTLARELLGHPYELIGKVAHGDKRGREFGYPTANIFLHRKQVPTTGIFAVRVHDINQQSYYGAAYIGIRSVFQGERVILEVNIFDFNQMIYGKNIRIELLKKIRDDQHFESVADLITQMQKDVAAVKIFLKIHFNK